MVLKGKVDHYNGIIVDPSSLPKDADKFKEELFGNICNAHKY
jgi:hypothetical protein